MVEKYSTSFDDPTDFKTLAERHSQLEGNTRGVKNLKHESRIPAASFWSN
jgi:hypothetical protein